MKCLISRCIIVTLVIPVFLAGAGKFKRIDQWKHDIEIFGHEYFSLLDKDNHLVGVFYKMGPRLITPREVIEFAPRGQGPNELMNLRAVFFYRGDLAVAEQIDKIKIFSKKDGTYKWKETKWLKRGKWAHSIKEGIFFDNKFFLSGYEQLDYKNNELSVSFLKVYDEAGKPLKHLIKKIFHGPNGFHFMRYHLVPYKTDRVFFLPENELKVTVISAKNLEVLKEVNLEIPAYYKKMPTDFYSFKQYDNPRDFLVDLENWAIGYSAITEAAAFGNQLVVQIRTCSEKMKKFALLFYSAESFKLEKTIFIDDYLLDVKDGKFYFFANGNPGRDEEAEKCIINIYAFEGEK